MFADADGTDNTSGNEDDDLRPGAGSPAIDSGDNSAVPTGVLTDINGDQRFQDDPATTDTGIGAAPIVDMGAYEVGGTAPVNQPPLAMPSASPLSGEAALPVEFSSAGSNDPDGTIDSYAWIFGDGSSDSSAAPNHVYTLSGNYTAYLTVTDNDGDTHTDSVAITVLEPVPNQVPVALISAIPTSGETPLVVSFDGSMSSDSDGPIVSWEWDFGDGSANASGISISHTYTAVGSYTAWLTVTDNDGDSASEAELITVTEAPPPSPSPAETDHVAGGEIAGAGTLSADYTMTWADDAGIQSITERESGGKRNRRYSYLVHTWQFNVTAGASVTVYANAWSGGSSDGDIFRFEWSTSASSGFQTLFAVDNNADSGSTQSKLIDATGVLSGPVYIRVVDTDNTAGNKILDTVHVDQLYIKTVTAAGDPPVAPSNLVVSAPTSSSLTLNWTDKSTDETGFTVERSTDGSTFSILTTVGTNITNFTDNSLNSSNTYWYRVFASNASGGSAPSNVSSGTTLAGSAITLDAVGYKVKGKQQVDLTWGGTAGTHVDIYRDSVVITTANDGAHTDNIGVKGGGSYTYKVCETGSTNCSDPVTVIF